MEANQETLLNVQGMSCPSCIRHVKEALNEVEGVSGVDVRLAAGQVKVQHARSANVTNMVEALRGAGYESAPSNGD